MNDGIDRGRALAGRKLVHAEMAGEGIEHLAAVGDVGNQIVDAFMFERDEIDVEDLVSLVGEIGDDVAPGLAGASGEDDTFAHVRNSLMLFMQPLLPVGP